MYLVLLFAIYSSLGWAHQSSLNSSGRELVWYNRNIPMVIRTNTSDMSSADVTTIIQNSIAEWNSSSSANINPVSASNNEIKFVSNFPYGNAVIGVTELSYNTSGAIQKAVVMLNDNYTFRNYSGFNAGGSIYLGDVVTHELGHVFGLSHSEVLDATMFYASFSGQSTVSLDDQTGIRQKYDSGYGSISGVVKGGENIPVLGVHVQAISRNTGKVTAVVSNENGRFKLGGLNLEDTYYIYTSPIKNPASLPGYFSNVQDRFCPASYVGSFFSKCGHDYEGNPQGISLTTAAPEVNVGTVTINCGLKANEEYNLQKLQTAFDPITIFTYDPDSEKTEQAYVGWFRNPSSDSFSASDFFKADFTALSDSSYYVKFSLVSFPFGSQLEFEVDVSNIDTHYDLGFQTLELSGVTETNSTDYEIFVPISTTATKNMFEFNVRAKKLLDVIHTFPSYESFSSGTFLPYLVIVSLWQDQSGVKVPVVISEANLSDNQNCLEAPFTFAVSKTNVANDSAGASTEEPVGPISCGTIEPPRNGPGSSLALLTLGFIFSILLSALLKSRKKFLS